MVQVRCTVCGSDFSVKDARLRKGQVKYCSVACQVQGRTGAERRPELRRQCLICGSRFLPKAHQRKDGYGKYCSAACYDQARSSDTSVQCDYCQKTFTRKRFQLSKRTVKHHYCSTDCRNAASRGPNYDPLKKDYRDGQYKKLSQQLSAAASACHDCGLSADEYQTHHVVPPWLFDDRQQAHDPSNLIVLCHTCHRKRHATTMHTLFQLFRSFCKDQPDIRHLIRQHWNGGSPPTPA